MAITLFGVSAIPTDNGTNATTTITITPPASMVAGDLVVAYCRQRGSTAWSVGVTGGQTWGEYLVPATTNVSVGVVYTIFDGTWLANPRFDNAGGTNTSVLMMVFRPSSGFQFVTPEVLQATNQATAAVITATGLNHTQASTISIASWHTADDNTWGTLTGTGWIKTGLSAQYRNLAGNDGSCTFAYKIQTAAGNTGNVSQTQLTLGNDLTRWTNVGFYEQLIPTPTTYDESTTLTSDNIIDVLAILSYHNAIILNSDHNIVTQVDASIMGTTDLTSNNTVDASNNAIVNSGVSLSSDGGFNEQGLTDYLNNSILLADTDVSITTTQIAELTLSLFAISQLDTSAGSEYLVSVNTQMDNQVLFNLFIDAYNLLSLSSETITTFDVVSVVNNILQLNINTEVLVNITNILDSTVSLSSENTIQIAGEVITSGTIYNESTALTINIDLFFIDPIEVFMKMLGALFVKNINKIIG